MNPMKPINRYAAIHADLARLWVRQKHSTRYLPVGIASDPVDGLS